MLIHRGPDSHDTYLSPDGICALGYTRLAIVDPTNRIAQPLKTPNGEAVISFNGEIYNYLEVRERLIRKGVSFRTRMDTEVLLEGLYREGEQFLQDLDGMWAFAYYDVPKKTLLLSRDLMGERHIFYHIDRETGEFIFASEVAPILAIGKKPFSLDQEAVVTALRFSAAPPGRTLLKEIQRIHAGHSIRLQVDSPINEYRYRKLHPEKWFDFFERNPSIDEVIEMWGQIFYRACARRLPLDVPFISTLSGGIDSTLICAFASDFGKKKIRTLYGESSDTPRQVYPDELDEFAASQFTSQKFHTDHLYTKTNSVESVPVLHTVAENGFDGSIGLGISFFRMLAHRVREEGLKVILISDGPDELLGGYPIDKRAYAIDQRRSENQFNYNLFRFVSSRKGGQPLLRVLGKEDWIIPREISYDPFRFTPIHSSISPELLHLIVPSDLVASSAQYYGTIDPVHNNILPSMDYTQMRALSYATKSLPDHFNLRSDKAFLSASVECRLPYQAPEMVEFMIAAPASVRFGDGTMTKYLLRKIVERRVDPKIAHRSKYGMGIPPFKTPGVYKAMDFKETLRISSLFDDFPFKQGAREFVLKSENRKIEWHLFVLAKTYDRLRRGVFV
ncbi:MAG: asparagine synthase (glutamine-hydrolyzing) [Deltaproteobacteria bacterium RIFCSPLOWO2_02_FULL_46_8]|nr:MAG: asparagine synthase (glutamine-hydrolyzing) [Deltaproteobacteria bacterium RIFCSPLOWO2_02_FULL_46_8]